MEIVEKSGTEIKVKEVVDARFKKQFNKAYDDLMKRARAKHKKTIIDGKVVWTTVPPIEQVRNIRCNHRRDYSVIKYDKLLHNKDLKNKDGMVIAHTPITEPKAIFVYKTDLNTLHKKYIEYKEKIKQRLARMSFGFLEY